MRGSPEVRKSFYGGNERTKQKKPNLLQQGKQRKPGNKNIHQESGMRPHQPAALGKVVVAKAG